MHSLRLPCVAHVSSFFLLLLVTDPGRAGAPLATGPTGYDGGAVPGTSIIQTVNTPPTSTWSGANSNLWSDPLNWDTPPGDGSNIDIPMGSMNTNMTNDTTLTYNYVSIEQPSGGISGANPLKLTDGFTADFGAATFLIGAPVALQNAAEFQSVSGTLFFTQQVTMNGTLSVTGADGPFFNAGLAGTGPIVIDITGTTAIYGSNSFTGSVQVNNGVVILDATPPLTNAIQVDGGEVTGTSGTSGPIDVSGTATVYPGSGTASYTSALAGIEAPTAVVAMWSTGPVTLSDGTQVVINFGSNNTTYSRITSTDALTINGGVLKLNFATTPTVGLTYGPLLLATTTRTGCPTEAVVCSPKGVEATPNCYLNTVAAKITATDSIFSARNDEPHEGCP